MNEIKVPISPGELLDKITILRIKSQRMSDPAKLSNVRLELRALEETWGASAYANIDIEAELDRGGNQARDQACAKRQLHVEQQLEAPSAQGCAQPP